MVSVAEEAQAAETPTEVGLVPDAPTALIQSTTLQDSLRLDGGYYNAETTQAHRIMTASGLTLKKLKDVTESIFIPPRFKRVYVDQAHGVPFLQGTHIAHFRPTDLKYLSRSAHKNLERWIIRSGWVLVTCSGTIGRVAISLQQWDGWAASQHILRVVPQDDGPCPAGYIYAWLTSPLGQAQFNGIYGAVVDELTADHVENILIPVPETEEQREIVSSINKLALEAIATKEYALEQDEEATNKVDQLIPGGSTTHIAPRLPQLNDTLAVTPLNAEFKTLVEQWRDETGILSSTSQKTNHPAYRQIIGMGDKAIPLILEELKQRPSHWFVALRSITGENPAPPEAAGYVEILADAWIKWGQGKGYIS